MPLNKAVKMSSEEEMHRRKNIKALCYFSCTVASLYQAQNVPLTHCVWMLLSSCSVCLCSCWRWKVSSSLNKANLQSPPLPVFSSHTKPWARQRTEDLLRLRDTHRAAIQEAQNKGRLRSKRLISETWLGVYMMLIASMVTSSTINLFYPLRYSTLAW